MSSRFSFSQILHSYGLPVTIAIISLVIQATSLQDTLDWQRSAINNSQWWLLVSGNFAHLDWQHYALNVIALLVIWELFFKLQKIGLSILIILYLCLTVGLGIYFFNADVEWYVGLSGILHGLFLIGISHDVFKKNLLSILVALGFIGKIVWEQTVGITTGALFSEDTVLVDAHLYGAIGGLVWIGLYHLYTKILFK